MYFNLLQSAKKFHRNLPHNLTHTYTKCVTSHCFESQYSKNSSLVCTFLNLRGGNALVVLNLMRSGLDRRSFRRKLVAIKTEAEKTFDSVRPIYNTIIRSIAKTETRYHCQARPMNKRCKILTSCKTIIKPLILPIITDHRVIQICVTQVFFRKMDRCII